MNPCVALLTGYVSYGFFEYIGHLLFHVFNIEYHMRHHRDPSYPDIGTPWLRTAYIGICILTACLRMQFYSLFWFLLPNFIGYGVYKRIHRHIHVVPIHQNRGYTWHLSHHILPNSNYGVLTRGWDILFGTYDKKTMKLCVTDFLPGIHFISQ